MRRRRGAGDDEVPATIMRSLGCVLIQFVCGDVMPASSFCEPNVPVAGIPCQIYLPRVIPAWPNVEVDFSLSKGMFIDTQSTLANLQDAQPTSNWPFHLTQSSADAAQVTGYTFT